MHFLIGNDMKYNMRTPEELQPEQKNPFRVYTSETELYEKVEELVAGDPVHLILRFGSGESHILNTAVHLRRPSIYAQTDRRDRIMSLATSLSAADEVTILPVENTPKGLG